MPTYYGADRNNYVWVTNSVTQTGTAATLYSVATTSTTATTNLYWNVWEEARAAQQAMVESDQARYRRATRDHYDQEYARVQQLIAGHQSVADERRSRQRAHMRGEAHRRAAELLLEHLSPAQRKTFVDNKWFIVVGASDARYRIRDNNGSVVANIDVLDSEDTITARLCGHAQLGIPHADQLLAQKMMLECDEEAFLRVANRHPAR